MAGSRGRYLPEYREQMVEVVRSGRRVHNASSTTLPGRSRLVALGGSGVAGIRENRHLQPSGPPRIRPP